MAGRPLKFGALPANARMKIIAEKLKDQTMQTMVVQLQKKVKSAVSFEWACKPRNPWKQGVALGLLLPLPLLALGLAPLPTLAPDRAVGWG